MDRKGVHILLCDHDPSSGAKTLALLQKCSYKVTAVKSERQVMEALESESAGVDIILSDVELPQEKCFKMLQHIMRQENLSHIAVVVMSERDDMAVVANCLRLGADDFLVKPLRLNEVINLWTHMWRRRIALGLPNKHALHGSINFPTTSLKSETTTDFLSGKSDKKCSIPSTDTGPAIDSSAEIPLQLELSLRLSTNYNAEKLPEQALDSETMHSSLKERVRHSSAFATYSKTCKQQPSEQSANVCSSGSPSPTWLENMNETSLTKFRASMLRALSTSAAFHESTKDFAVTDENRSVNMESQICDAPCQDISPVQSNTVAERVFHARQVPAMHVQGYQQCHKMVESPGVDMQQGFTANVQEVCATSLKQGDFPNPTMGSPQAMQQLPSYHCEAGMVNFPAIAAIPNVYSYYPLAHMALPQFMSFSTWPSMITAAPMVGGKIIQAQRREAALNKFRMKRKGRCFEKKIRYASRKKLAEQRPRVRGQFVRRTVTMESAESPTIGNGYVDEEEGEADDESELDNNSSPDCMAESCRVG